MLLTHALVTVVTGGVQDGHQDPVVLQQHDVRPLVWEAPPASGELALLPFPYPEPTRSDELEEGDQPWIGPSDLIEVIQKVIEPEFWESDEADIEARGNVLWIRAPDSVQRRIEALLRSVHSSLFPEQRLHVRVFRGPGIPTGTPALEPEVADRILADGIQAGSLQLLATGSTTLVDGLVKRIDATRTRTLTLDWEVEIAHAATVYGPVLQDLDTGLVLQVRSGAAPGGVALDLAMCFSEMPAPPRTQSLEVATYVGTGVPDTSCRDINVSGDGLRDESLRALEHQLTLELPEVRFFSFASSLLIPHGKVLWVPLQSTHANDDPPALLELRVEGPTPPHLWRFDADDPGREYADLAEVPAGASVLEIRRPGAWSRTGVEVGRRARWKNDRYTGDVVWCRARIEEPPVAREVRVHLARTENAHRGDLHHAWLLGHLVLSYPARIARRLTNDLEALPGVEPQLSLHGEVTATDGYRGSFSIPVRTGRSASIWAGREGAYLWEWDVDVAGYALVANPGVRSWFDGHALNFDVLALGDERFQVRVNGILNLRHGEPVVLDYQTPVMPFVEKLEFDRLAIDEVRTVALGEEVMLGDERLGLRLRLESWPGEE